MRVLHIGKYYPPFFGGIEKVNFDLVEGLNKSGIETDQICFNKVRKDSIEKSKYSTIYRCGVIVNLFGQPISLSLLLKLFKIVKEYDIIHLHLPNPFASLVLFFLKKNQRLVLHWHNDIIKQQKLMFFYRPLQTRLLKRSNAIIGTSPEYLASSKDLEKFNTKTHVLPIGVSEDDIVIDEKFARNLKNTYRDKKVILSVGRLSRYKGYEYLIKSAKYLKEDIIILIIGEGEERGNLSELIKNYDLDENVKLLGKVKHEQLGAYYQLCDVFCMSSITRNEGFGIVQIEAMLMKKPVVTTEIEGSGISFGNIGGVTGITTPIKDANKLAQAFKTILEDQKLAKSYSENGYERATTIFSTKKMIDRTIEIYHSITK